jgi:hypothetical protein
MKSQVNLFFSKEQSQYYWVGRNICDKCNKNIELQGLLSWDYWKNNFRESIYCFNCRKEILNVAGPYVEFKKVSIGFTELLPSDVIGVWPERPSLVNASGLTNVEVATQSSDSLIIDKTVYASKNNLLIEGKDQKLISKKDEVKL